MPYVRADSDWQARSRSAVGTAYRCMKSSADGAGIRRGYLPSLASVALSWERKGAPMWSDNESDESQGLGLRQVAARDISRQKHC